MNNDLMLSILAMDSYNRGYGVGLELDPAATQIGNASISRSKSGAADIAGTIPKKRAVAIQHRVAPNKRFRSIKGTALSSSEVT